MAKKRTPPRGKNGRFLSKAQRAARARGRKQGGGGARRGRARSTAASSAAATVRETAHQRRQRAARKGARTRARNAAHHARRPARRGGRGHSREAIVADARSAARAAARDLLTTQRGPMRGRSGKAHWHGLNRWPAGHPRAGQFKGARPGAGHVQDNPHAMLAAAENPMGMAAWLVGGFSLAVGAFSANLLDRVVATTALTDTATKDAAGNEIYSDTMNAGSSSYAGMSNAASYSAPMNIWRWVFGGVAAVVPMAGGAALQHFTHDGWPKTQAFLNFGGLGAFGNLIVKGGTDAAAYMLKGTAFGQRAFDIEIRAQALKAGSSYAGPTPPSTGLGAWSAHKTLGGYAKPKSLAGCGEGCDCDPCKKKREPPPRREPPPPPPGGQHQHEHRPPHAHGHPPPPPRHVPPPCVPAAGGGGGPSLYGAPGMGALPKPPRIPHNALSWGG